MSARPILFRDDMVRAILDGRKTVTRRVGPTWARVRAGDRLWVREAHALLWVHGDGPPDVESPDLRDDYYVEYRADGSPGRYPGNWPPETRTDPERPRWRPSIHMPRWACRLELDVVSVTDQRARPLVDDWGRMQTRMPDVDDGEAHREGFASRSAFIRAWQSMHGDYVGPVWRVEFAPVRP